jgi:DNA-binding NarL/FixJ family response regulator
MNDDDRWIQKAAHAQRPVPRPVAMGARPTQSAVPRKVLPGLRPIAARVPASLVKVLLCEDQEVFRVGLRVVLEAQPDIAVVAETNHLPGAVRAVDGVDTQVVVVVRQSLVGSTTLPLLREMCRRGTAVLVLAEPGEESESGLVEVLQAGVLGYLPRRSAAQRLVDGVRALSNNQAALDSTATSQLVRYLTGPARRERPVRALDQLTDRQRDVAALVAEGLSNEEIAGRLFLSLATVKSHLTASMRRLGVRTRTQLAIMINRDPTPV